MIRYTNVAVIIEHRGSGDLGSRWCLRGGRNGSGKTVTDLESRNQTDAVRPIVYLMTPPGRGAVATVRIEGDRVVDRLDATGLFRAASGRDPRSVESQRILYGTWGRGIPEDVVLVKLSADVCEIHGHGGQAAPQRILSDLEQQGFLCRESFDVRVDRQCLLLTELEHAIEQAVTIRVLGWLLRQPGAWMRFIDEFQANLAGTQPDWAAVDVMVEGLRRWADFGRRLLVPRQIALLGRPNAGKSSLVNSLLGYARSIVHSTPGTTRDLVTSTTVIDGWPVQLIDTAGLRTSLDPLERQGMNRAVDVSQQSELVMLVIDRSVQPTAEDRQLLQTWSNAVIAANKIDRTDAWGSMLPSGAWAVSAKTGEGLAELIKHLGCRLVDAEPAQDEPLILLARHQSCLSKLAHAVKDRDPAGVEHAVSVLRDGH